MTLYQKTRVLTCFKCKKEGIHKLARKPLDMSGIAKQFVFAYICPNCGFINEYIIAGGKFVRALK